MCVYGNKKRESELFMKSVSDHDLFRRRENHEAERANKKFLRAGTTKRGSRLIWMRAVRREIARRRLGT